jgi:hypothetical protein
MSGNDIRRCVNRRGEIASVIRGDSGEIGRRLRIGIVPVDIIRNIGSKLVPAHGDDRTRGASFRGNAQLGGHIELGLENHPARCARRLDKNRPLGRSSRYDIGRRKSSGSICGDRGYQHAASCRDGYSFLTPKAATPDIYLCASYAERRVQYDCALLVYAGSGCQVAGDANSRNSHSTKMRITWCIDGQEERAKLICCYCLYFELPGLLVVPVESDLFVCLETDAEEIEKLAKG